MLWFATPVASALADEPKLQTGVPILVREAAGVDRVREPATFGVPIAESENVKSVSDLVVLDPLGKPVLSQIRVLERWRAAPDDGTARLKWVLVDLQVTVAPNTTVSYQLRKASSVEGKPSKKAPKLSTKEKGAKITIDTGEARFVISKKRASFLESLRADFDHDGRFESSESLIDGADAPGFVLTDRLGAKYTTAGYALSTTVDESGPLRTVIRVDGRHAPTTAGGGIARDFLRFTTWYTFYAGKGYIGVQHSLKNDYLEAPLGQIGFESYSLPLTLHQSSAGTGPTFRGSFGLGDGTTFSKAGALRLYQDSDGGAKWNLAPNTTFSGFRISDSEVPAAGDVVSEGGQAAGYMSVGDDKRGLVIVMRDFFENFPKGFAFDGDRTARFDIFPAETASFHWLDDAQQKTTQFFVSPYRATATAPFDSATFAKRLTNPLHPYIDPTYMRHSKAWGDQGSLDDPPQDDAALLTYDANQLNGVYQQAFTRSNYTFGWSEFGEFIWAKSTHTTGSPRNKLSYFDRFAINGSAAAFRIHELFALHSRDIRPYHIGGFDYDDHPQALMWEGVPHVNSVDKLGRNMIPSTLAAHKAGIVASGHGWNGFDIEHMVVDDLYEYYLLTGDPVCRESLAAIGQCMRTWPIYILNKSVGSSRGVGWSLRAMLRIYRVTGDPRILAIADLLVEVVNNTYNKSPSPVTGEIYHWVTRYLPNASHIATAEHDIPWQLATVIHGMLLHHRETGSETSLAIALDISDYLCDHCWDPIAHTMAESVACDNDEIVNPKPDNTGVNTWIPSALAVAYRYSPRVEYLGYAQAMYNSVPNLQAWNSYYGWGLYHWWHDYRSLILGE